MKDVKKAHKHAELIKQWADGAEIQWLNRDRIWQDAKKPEWYDEHEYRVKPREFPKSSLSDGDLAQAYMDVGALRAIADAAIKQYILDLEKESANGF